MARMNLKLKTPVTDFDFDVDENSLESNGWVRIVRCRECKWYEADLYANPWGVCFHKDWVANNIGHTVDEDGFCYRGEREAQE